MEIPRGWQVVLAEKAFYQNRFPEAAGHAMDALKIGQLPMPVSETLHLFSNTSDDEIANWVTLSGVLVKSFLATSAKAWNPREVLKPLLEASNIRDVVFHNPLFHSRLSKLDNYDALLVAMVREEARLLELSSSIFSGQKREKLLTNSGKLLESAYQGLPEGHPLRHELNLDLCFYNFRHSREVDKVGLGMALLESFQVARDYSDPKLLAAYAIGVYEVGVRFDNRDLMWDGQNTLGNLRAADRSLPKPVFEVSCLLGDMSLPNPVSSFILKLAPVSRVFRQERSQLFKDLGYQNNRSVQVAFSGKSG